MRIKPNETLGNIPILQIRHFFQIYYRGFTLETLKDFFSLSLKDAKTIIDELLSGEYIINKTDELIMGVGDYVLCKNGFMLCAARAIPPISREKADKYFNEFMERVHEVNNDDYYLWTIDKVYLFGSYLDKNKTDYGDIDIFILLKNKEPDYAKYTNLREKRIEELRKKGKHFKSFLDELNFPEYEIQLKLKNRCRYLSIQPYDVELAKKIKHKQVYSL